jgi:hypothetical protein
MVHICRQKREEELRAPRSTNSRPDLAGERRRPELARTGDGGGDPRTRDLPRLAWATPFKASSAQYAASVLQVTTHLPGFTNSEAGHWFGCNTFHSNSSSTITISSTHKRQRPNRLRR